MSLQRRMSFMDHLAELRARLIKAGVAVVIASIGAFVVNERILEVLARPFEEAVVDGRLAVFRPTEAFSTQVPSPFRS